MEECPRDFLHPALLEDRFQFAYHFQQQQRNVSALLLADGCPKFKKSTGH